MLLGIAVLVWSGVGERVFGFCSSWILWLVWCLLVFRIGWWLVFEFNLLDLSGVAFGRLCLMAVIADFLVL